MAAFNPEIISSSALPYPSMRLRESSFSRFVLISTGFSVFVPAIDVNEPSSFLTGMVGFMLYILSNILLSMGCHLSTLPTKPATNFNLLFSVFWCPDRLIPMR
ncbi:hypothetical protein ES705_37143 [subsurface metagenome]